MKNNIDILVDAKKEYTNQLKSKLVPINLYLSNPLVYRSI